MAIIRRKIGQRRTAVREFTDRIDPREAFSNRYEEMVKEKGSTIITFYGAGGIGKTSLVNELMNELDQQQIPNLHYLYHGFINGVDMRAILKRWKNQLEEAGCEFPLFETGDFYLSIKQGKDISDEQIKSWLAKNKWLLQIKRKLAQASEFVDTVIPVFSAVSMAIDVTGAMLNVFPGVKTLSALMGVVDKIMADRERQKQLENHDEIRQEINRRFAARNLYELEEYLPMLFAQDVRDWVEMSGGSQKLIIFLETYELLTGAINAENQLSASNTYRDWWIRDDTVGHEGLIFTMPPTLWVIAGRNKLRWTGELAEELKNNQHLLETLSYDDSNHFLKTANIRNSELRDGIIKLTDGYPLYLDVCVDTYERYLSVNGTEPTIEEFGQNRERIIDRLMKYMDDKVRLMVNCLCILGTWTDEMAHDIVINYDPNVYINAKKFSFIQSRFVPLNDEEIEVFVFDRTLQRFILDEIKNNKDLSYLIDETQDIANKYFDKFINDREYINDTFIYYLKLWSEFIINLIDEDEKLVDQYENYLSFWVNNLIDAYEIAGAEYIVNAFMDKATEINGTNNRAYIIFEGELGTIRNAQGNYSAAFELRQSAYEKSLNLLGKNHPDTTNAMNNLALTLNDLGKYDEALDLQEQVLALREEILDESHPDTISAMNNLALTLNNLGKYDEALELQEQVFTLYKEILGENHPDTISAMNNLASTLIYLGKYDEALEIQEQVFALRKEILGDNHPDTISAMLNLALTLSGLGKYDEALNLHEQVLPMMQKILGNEHYLTIDAMMELSKTLNKLGRYDEAKQYAENALKLGKENLPDNNRTLKEVIEWHDELFGTKRKNDNK